jgi:hypothetical protein
MSAPRKPHTHHMLIGDGGYLSRKLFAFLLTDFLLVAFAVIASHYPAIIVMFSEYAASVIAVFALYLGGNIGGKFAIGKVLGADNAMEVTSNKEPLKATPAAAQPPPQTPATPGA